MVTPPICVLGISGLRSTYTLNVDQLRLAKLREPLGQSADGVTSAAL